MVASDNLSVVAYLKKQGGTHSPSLCMLVWELLYWCHHQNIHIQVRHIPGKLNVLADSLSRPDRILPTEWSLDWGIAHHFQALGYFSSGSLCHQIKPSAAPVCFSSTGSQGLCSGCYVPRMEKPICICISSIVALVLNKIRDSNSQFILIALLWPQRSWFSVILSLIIDFPRELPVHRGLVSLHHNPSVTSSRLDVVRSQIRGRHISEFATQCISQSRRESMLKVCSVRWRIFSDWCQQREVNPIDPSLTKLIDLFCYLFDTLKLSVASIKGYCSAISNTLKFSKAADCTADPIISDLKLKDLLWEDLFPDLLCPNGIWLVFFGLLIKLHMNFKDSGHQIHHA